MIGKRIATSYPETLRRYLQARGVEADVVVLTGCVEIANAVVLRQTGLRPQLRVRALR